MCGRFSLFTNPTAYLERLGVDFTLDWSVKYNISPSQKVLAVVGGDETNSAQYMVWGLSPNWSKRSLKIINARCECLSSKPSFFQSFRLRRCIILGNGFFEWKKQSSKSVPYFFHLENNEIFAFAGLYDVGGGGGISSTIITTEANSVVENVHDRMPAILNSKKDVLNWLSPGFEEEKLIKLLEPYGGNDFVGYSVSDKVNNVSFDDSNVIEAFVWPQQSLDKYL